MKAIEQYFHVVLFITLYKVVLTLRSVDETLVCEDSNESYWAVLSCGIVYYSVKGGSYFQLKAIESFWVVCNGFFFSLQVGSASFYPPVSLEIKQQLKGHLLSIIRTLPEDLQFVLKNS